MSFTCFPVVRSVCSLGLLACVALTLNGCSKKEGGEPTGKAASAVSAEAQKEAQELFQNRCVTCHGASGTGDGPAASALNPKPRNYRDKAWQGSVTDAQIETIIVSGGSAVGKSALMPPNPDLEAKPAVVSGLREIIRNFGK